jgi:hypothetical protein
MGPVQKASGLREVPPLFLLDPRCPVGNHHHWAGRIALACLGGGFGQVAELFGGAKGSHQGPLDQAMPLPGRAAWRSALAPGKGRIDLAHG